MSHRTVVLSSFNDFLADECSPEGRAEETKDRDVRLARFPYAVMLLVSFPEMDFADRWCWQRFGPRDGECIQPGSEYPVCTIEGGHSHTGKWTSHWFAKTDYNFGFNEWYFAEEGARELFLASVSEINWGENFPKKGAQPGGTDNDRAAPGRV
jgi:hypothetical protein